MKGVVGLCNPFDLFYLKLYVVQYMFGYFHKLFGHHLLRVFREHMDQLRPLEKEVGPLEAVAKKIKTITDYDNLITARTHGYGTAHLYYRKGSSVLVLGDIVTPTLFVNSLDDPVVCPTVIPYDECRENPNIILATFPFAGHLGFCTGLRPRQVKLVVKW